MQLERKLGQRVWCQGRNCELAVTAISTTAVTLQLIDPRQPQSKEVSLQKDGTFLMADIRGTVVSIKKSGAVVLDLTAPAPVRFHLLEILFPVDRIHNVREGTKINP